MEETARQRATHKFRSAIDFKRAAAAFIKFLKHISQLQFALESTPFRKSVVIHLRT